VIKSIQALRALAVSVVVLNHYFPYRVPGGFIGVDVFFVVSGFLMTNRIIADIDAGRFSFLRFYSRRAARLLPAALAVLLVSLLATLIWLPVTAQSASLNDIAAACLYVLNWRLILKDTSYFADHTHASIVLHYWSLSIEEQFYFVWPALVTEKTYSFPSGHSMLSSWAVYIRLRNSLSFMGALITILGMQRM
jgi:peptidoglycan/LPS O-acetylase OafA/YrhL